MKSACNSAIIAAVVCRSYHVLFTLFVFAYVLWCPTHIVLCLICFPRLVYPMLPVSLDCPFLIATSVFSNVYLLKFFRLFGDSKLLCFMVFP